MWPNLKSGLTNGLIDASAQIQNNLTSQAYDNLKSTYLLRTYTLILRQIEVSEMFTRISREVPQSHDV